MRITTPRLILVIHQDSIFHTQALIIRRGSTSLVLVYLSPLLIDIEVQSRTRLPYPLNIPSSEALRSLFLFLTPQPVPLPLRHFPVSLYSPRRPIIHQQAFLETELLAKYQFIELGVKNIECDWLPWVCSILCRPGELQGSNGFQIRIAKSVPDMIAGFEVFLVVPKSLELREGNEIIIGTGIEFGMAVVRLSCFRHYV